MTTRTTDKAALRNSWLEAVVRAMIKDYASYMKRYCGAGLITEKERDDAISAYLFALYRAHGVPSETPPKDYSVCIAKIDGKWQFVSATVLETEPGPTCRTWFDERGDLITEKTPNEAQ